MTINDLPVIEQAMILIICVAAPMLICAAFGIVLQCVAWQYERRTGRDMWADLWRWEMRYFR